MCACVDAWMDDCMRRWNDGCLGGWLHARMDGRDGSVVGCVGGWKEGGPQHSRMGTVGVSLRRRREKNRQEAVGPRAVFKRPAEGSWAVCGECRVVDSGRGSDEVFCGPKALAPGFLACSGLASSSLHLLPGEAKGSLPASPP